MFRFSENWIEDSSFVVIQLEKVLACERGICASKHLHDHWESETAAPKPNR